MYQILYFTLVWKQGMIEWTQAKNIDELKGLFMEIPPIPQEV